MDERLENYLNKVSVYLKSVPISERVDIISEIKSHMEELQYKNSFTPEKIIAQLGTEKDLAQAYLGNAICESKAFQFRKFFMATSFYSLTGLFVIPTFGVIAVAFKFSSVVTILAGSIKTIASIAGIDVPFVMFQVGSYSLPSILVLPASIAIGVLFYIGGNASWKLVLKYIKSVSEHKKEMIKE